MPRALPADRLRTVVRRTAPLLGALFVVLLAAAPAAMADALTPDSGGSPNANDIDLLYKIALGLGIVIFLLVEGVLVYSLVKFRYRRGGPEPAQIRGNTPLEVGWTIGAALFLVVLTTVTFIYLGDIENPKASKRESQAQGVKYAAIGQEPVPGGKKLEVRVNGQQYLWRYEYDAPGDAKLFSYHDLYVPVGTTVVLKITSSDVVHSWWIPKLGPKSDATPGHTNDAWFRIDKAGEYYGECAELCGDNHADMRARVIALPPDEFTAWQRRQIEDIKRAQSFLSLQRKVRGEN